MFSIKLCTDWLSWLLRGACRVAGTPLVPDRPYYLGKEQHLAIIHAVIHKYVSVDEISIFSVYTKENDTERLCFNSSSVDPHGCSRVKLIFRDFFTVLAFPLAAFNLRPQASMMLDYPLNWRC